MPLILHKHLYRPAAGLVVAAGMGSGDEVHTLVGLRMSAPNPMRGLNIPGLFEIL